MNPPAQAEAGPFARAAGVLAGGVDSPVRGGKAVGGEPFVQVRGTGAYAFGADGRRYLDYVMAYGPLLLGHGHPAVSTHLDHIAAQGAVFGSTHPSEIDLAERIRGYLPSMERMRFTSTGSEAVMSAVRVARAATGRSLIVKFGGNYHGHFDLALLDAGASAHTADAARSGIPEGVMRDVIVSRYNDLAEFDRRLEGREGELAAILVEPIVGNMGLVFAVEGFLEGLMERARRYGALVIFDEVITWLRVGMQGAQGRLELQPDLTTVGKIVGGGFPLAAFGGRRDVMRHLAPEGGTFTGGTHAGNPFSVALGHRVLDFLEAHPQVYVEMDERARRLADGIRGSLVRMGLAYAVLQYESIVDFKFRPGPPTRSYDDQARSDRAAYAAYYHAMRARGVLLPPSHNEVMFLSVAHDDDDILQTLEAVEGSLIELREKGVI